MCEPAGARAAAGRAIARVGGDSWAGGSGGAGGVRAGPGLEGGGGRQRGRRVGEACETSARLVVFKRSIRFHNRARRPRSTATLAAVLDQEERPHTHTQHTGAHTHTAHGRHITTAHIHTTQHSTQHTSHITHTTHTHSTHKHSHTHTHHITHTHTHTHSTHSTHTHTAA